MYKKLAMYTKILILRLVLSFSSDMKTLNQTLSKLREQYGYTQEELARMLNISRVTLATIESGKRPVSKEELIQYSDIFDIPVDAIKQ